MSDEERTGFNRRDFLRRAAATTAAAAWAAPVIQTIAATPAHAQTLGTPVPQDCFHSVGGTGEGCMGACTGSGCTGNSCDGVDPDPNNPLGQGPCQFYCPSGQGGDNPCCNPGLCDTSNFVCHNEGTETEFAEYTGSLVGCS